MLKQPDSTNRSAFLLGKTCSGTVGLLYNQSVNYDSLRACAPTRNSVEDGRKVRVHNLYLR